MDYYVKFHITPLVINHWVPEDQQRAACIKEALERCQKRHKAMTQSEGLKWKDTILLHGFTYYFLRKHDMNNNMTITQYTTLSQKK